jgi:hypothetical protein
MHTFFVFIPWRKSRFERRRIRLSARSVFVTFSLSAVQNATARLAAKTLHERRSRNNERPATDRARANYAGFFHSCVIPAYTMIVKGTATTLKAAVREGMDALGVEQSSEYCESARFRMSRL